MISKLIAVFALTLYLVVAQTPLSLPVTQDFAVSNNGYSGAQISRPDSLSFFNNGFQSSVAYFGIDLAPLALYDINTVTSATLTFTNYTVSQGSSATIAITLLNYGQVFDESTVTLNTQPTSQGTLGSATFTAGGSATVDVTNKLAAAQSSGGLFGFRVDPPGGPVSVASHRVNPNAVYISVVFGGTTTTQAAATTTTTVAPVPTTSTTNAPGSPTTTTTTTTAAPTPANCWTCGAGWVHWYQVPGMAQPGSDPCACVQASSTTTTTKAPASGSTTTTKAPTAGPTSTFSSGSSSQAPATTAPSSTDAPRSSATKASAALLCIVPLALALLL